jgi:flagellar hook-length control protein FliK
VLVNRQLLAPRPSLPGAAQNSATASKTAATAPPLRLNQAAPIAGGAAGAKQSSRLIDQLAARAPRSGNQPRFVPAEADDKFAAQLGRGFAAALRQGGGSVTLRLRPEALGDLKIRLELSGSQVDARFEAASDQARGLLSESLGSLRSALEARGLEVAGLHVTVGDPPDQVGQPHHAAGNHTDEARNENQAGSGHSGSEHPADRETAAKSRPETAEPEDRLGWIASRDATVNIVETGGAPGLCVRVDALA